MSRNSIEKRSTLLEKSWVNRSRCNPESSTSIVIPQSIPIKQKKYQESTTSIRNINSDAYTLQGRYEALQKMYKGLMVKVSIQNQSVAQQQREKQKLQNQHEKNQKQIKKLRGMLGFLQKKDKGMQTQPSQLSKNTNQDSKMRHNKDSNKHQNSRLKEDLMLANNAQNQYNQYQGFTTSPKSNLQKTRQSNFNQSWVTRSSKYLFNHPNHVEYRPSKQERAKSPGGLKQKFRFIPSLPLY